METLITEVWQNFIMDDDLVEPPQLLVVGADQLSACFSNKVFMKMLKHSGLIVFCCLLSAKPILAIICNSVDSLDTMYHNLKDSMKLVAPLSLHL